MITRFLLIFIALSYVSGVFASYVGWAQNSDSGLPIPRFVSIKADVANARRGPGDEFPILWQYRSPHLPLEVVAEYKDWRRVRDYLGDESWMKHWLLSGKRYVIITARTQVPLHARASGDSSIRSYLAPKIIAKLEECTDAWCEIRVNHADFKGSGWIGREHIWGAVHLASSVQ